MLTPDKGLPGTGGDGAQDRAFLGVGLLACGFLGGAQFAVDCVLVDVREELIEEAVGAFEFEDVVGGQEEWEAFLPGVVAAFDFAFGLVCGLHPRRTNQNGFSPSRIPFTLGAAGASS